MSTPGHEVFDTNYDYHYAAEQRKSGEKGLVQKLGERAITWFRGMNEKRKAEKAERNYSGSLDEIAHTVEPAPPKPDMAPPRPVAAEPGVYRSNVSGEQPHPELTAQETDDIMFRAVRRARKNLGALPVIAMHQPAEPGDTQPHTATPYRDERSLRDTKPGQDEALLARLKRAYAQPAAEPDRSDHDVREDDDQLASTKGK